MATVQLETPRNAARVISLRDLVLKRLDADTKPEDECPALVLAALKGPEELAKLLKDGSALPSRAPSAVTWGKRSAVALSASPRIAFLRGIAVEGLRGIGKRVTLDRALV